MPEPLIIRGRPPRSTAVALLQAQGLPISDITDEHLEHFFFIGSDGSLTGYGGGLERKRWLLAHEKALGSTPELPFLVQNRSFPRSD